MYKVEAERNLAEKMTTSRSEALMPGMKEQEKVRGVELVIHRQESNACGLTSVLQDFL